MRQAIFISSLLGHFGRYLERERIDFVRDGVGYREVALYLLGTVVTEGILTLFGLAALWIIRRLHEGLTIASARDGNLAAVRDGMADMVPAGAENRSI